MLKSSKFSLNTYHQEILYSYTLNLNTYYQEKLDIYTSNSDVSKSVLAHMSL